MTRLDPKAHVCLGGILIVPLHFSELVCFFCCVGFVSGKIFQMANKDGQPIAYPAERESLRSSVNAGLWGVGGWIRWLASLGSCAQPRTHPNHKSQGCGRSVSRWETRKSGGRNNFMFPTKYRLTALFPVRSYSLCCGGKERKKPDNHPMVAADIEAVFSMGQALH